MFAVNEDERQHPAYDHERLADMPGIEPVSEYFPSMLPAFALIPKTLVKVLENTFKVVFILNCIHYRIEESRKGDEDVSNHDLRLPKVNQPPKPAPIKTQPAIFKKPLPCQQPGPPPQSPFMAPQIARPAPNTIAIRHQKRGLRNSEF